MAFLLWLGVGVTSFFFFFQAEDGIRVLYVTGVQTCALPIACKPHELTQMFVDSAGNKFTHRAPWTLQDSRLYRLLEMVTLRPLQTGVAMGGRIPGKVNINAINDIDIWRAICDAQNANQFADTDAQTIYNAM